MEFKMLLKTFFARLLFNCWQNTYTDLGMREEKEGWSWKGRTKGKYWYCTVTVHWNQCIRVPVKSNVHNRSKADFKRPPVYFIKMYNSSKKSSTIPRTYRTEEISFITNGSTFYCEKRTKIRSSELPTKMKLNKKLLYFLGKVWTDL